MLSLKKSFLFVLSCVINQEPFFTLVGTRSSTCGSLSSGTVTEGGGRAFSAKFRVGVCRPHFQNGTVG